MKYQVLQHFCQRDFLIPVLTIQRHALASQHLQHVQLLQQLPLDHSKDKNADRLECNGRQLQYLVGEYGCKAVS